MEEATRKALAGAVIVVAHALALHALIVAAPALKSIPSTVLAAHFISSPEPPRQWQPPAVNVVSPLPQAAEPTALAIEVPIVPPAADRAITTVIAAVPATTVASTPKLVSQVEYVREPAPRYPPQSRRLREQGVVVLRVLIDEQGNATSVDVESSSGHARLDAAAREAVQRAAFRPYVEDGAPRRALVRIPIEFALNRGTA